MPHETRADHYRATAKDCAERGRAHPTRRPKRVYEDKARQWLALAQPLAGTEGRPLSRCAGRRGGAGAGMRRTGKGYDGR